MKWTTIIGGGLAMVALSLIRGADNTAPTWAGSVAPILYQNCVECHRPGSVAPFSLLTATDAIKRAQSIAKFTKNRVMPPWLPATALGTFDHERGLTSAEIAVLSAWAAAGAPIGDTSKAPTAPPAPSETWDLGPPDVIVKMPRAFTVPAGPDDVYQAFVIPLPPEKIPADVLERSRLPDSNLLGVAAIEVHPGNRRALHHAHVWIDTSGEARRLERAAGGVGYAAFGNPGFNPDGYLGGHVPGTRAQRLPPGIAEAMSLGGDLVLQVHYHPSGKEETDQTEVGIYFVREPIKRTVEWMRLGSFNIDIPAGVADYTLSDELEVPADCFLLSISPHMHLLGREVTATATLPDGTTCELLTLTRWDFRWQDRYSYHQPVYLPRGTKVRTRWVYDNSEANPRNPASPPKPVHFGPGTHDEMCELHLFLIPRDIADYPAFPALMEHKMAEKIAELTPEQKRRYGFIP